MADLDPTIKTRMAGHEERIVRWLNTAEGKAYLADEKLRKAAIAAESKVAEDARAAAEALAKEFEEAETRGRHAAARVKAKATDKPDTK